MYENGTVRPVEMALRMGKGWKGGMMEAVNLGHIVRYIRKRHSVPPG
jgi:hypothetical protein